MTIGADLRATRLARIATILALGLATLPTGGCAGTPIPAERGARDEVKRVGSDYRPAGEKPALPVLSSRSALADYLRFAMLNAPRVEAAYYDWVAAVERITPARSPPDPRLTFEADIADTVMSLMPGLMIDLPGPGKLRAAGDVAAAESQTAYFAFESEVLRAALAVKTAYYRLSFLSETVRVQRRTLELLRDLEDLARQQNAAGRVTLQDVLRAQIAEDQLETQLRNREDSRSTLVAEFKAALGLGPDDNDPPIPETFEPSRAEPDPDTLLPAALERNPSLRAMASDVRRAEASIALAGRSGVPDFSVGLEADVRASPTVFTSSAGVTLPIWRDKVAAEIAAAQAGRSAAEARLSAEEVSIAAELASMLYAYREAVRNETLLTEKLVPKARQSLEAARAGYVNGRASFLDVIDAQRSLLDFELSNIEARTQRELALASLSLSIAGLPPATAHSTVDAPTASASVRATPDSRPSTPPRNSRIRSTDTPMSPARPNDDSANRAARPGWSLAMASGNRSGCWRASTPACATGSVTSRFPSWRPARLPRRALGSRVRAGLRRSCRPSR